MEELFDVLSEGNQNSLGRGLEVFNNVLGGEVSSKDVYDLYYEDDKTVSMRVSNILKRLWRENTDYVLPLIDTFIIDASTITNPTFRWSIAQIYQELHDVLNENQRSMIVNVVFDTILISDDWIALTQSMEAVLQFMKRNGAVSKRVQLRIQELSEDSRKTVSRKALKLTTLMEV